MTHGQLLRLVFPIGFASFIGLGMGCTLEKVAPFAGNQSKDAEIGAVDLVAVPRVAPEAVIVSGPPAGGTSIQGTTVTIGWEGHEHGNAIVGYVYYLTSGEAPLLRLPHSPHQPPWVSVPADCTSVTFTGLSTTRYFGDLNGLHTFIVLAFSTRGLIENEVEPAENTRRWESIDF